ncbi:MAG: cysteine hydrolase [Candidatus Colwellbacteria bacterium]|nr:cysteine hydrolase [Candidatus Colwellbacteria bacterium]
MPNIKIPKSNRKRALILVDIQKSFVKNQKSKLIKNLDKLLKQEKYDLFIEATFHAEKGSLWDRQTHWTFPYEPMISEITKKLLKGKKIVKVIKETRSAFKGNKNILALLRKKKIEEIHVAGFDINDCVFATAQESFDYGFYTYVIEECVGSSAGVALHKAAIKILRYLGLTNHS